MLPVSLAHLLFESKQTVQVEFTVCKLYTVTHTEWTGHVRPDGEAIRLCGGQHRRVLIALGRLPQIEYSSKFKHQIALDNVRFEAILISLGPLRKFAISWLGRRRSRPIGYTIV